MSDTTVPCVACLQRIPHGARKCHHCGSFQTPAEATPQDWRLFKWATGISALITAASALAGAAIYALDAANAHSDTWVSDISPNASEWYIAYENRGNVASRMGMIVLTEIYPEPVDGAAGARRYLPLSGLASPDRLSIEPKSSRSIQIAFDVAEDRPFGTLCELVVEVFEYATEKPRQLLFRRDCPGPWPRQDFDRPVAQDVTPS